MDGELQDKVNDIIETAIYHAGRDHGLDDLAATDISNQATQRILKELGELGIV